MSVIGDQYEVPVAEPPTRRRLSPSLRDGLALVLSNGLTSAVGLAYWVLAARLFPPAAVGVNSVAISTMMLLGGVAQLNMTYALLRFVPVAGRVARRLVVGGYLVGAGRRRSPVRCSRSAPTCGPRSSSTRRATCR